MSLLLDTCAAIWLTNADPISDEAVAALRDANETGDSVYVSPITAWEIGLFAARGRVRLLMEPQRWFERLLDGPGLRLTDMPPNVLIASSFLPGTLPGDPADRIIAATAREYGYKLLTRDRPLLDYAEQGHIEAIRC
ncbi:MAG: type II toxin-antitoxin system VapC family toxin [Xanthobacteraceae bacterium]